MMWILLLVLTSVSVGCLLTVLGLRSVWHLDDKMVVRWHLLIDYDENMAMFNTSTLAARLGRAGYSIRRIDRKISPSGKGEHVRILLHREPSSPMEIVALQSVCGSDPLRESANVLRARNLPLVPKWWRSRWNVLYGRGQDDRTV